MYIPDSQVVVLLFFKRLHLPEQFEVMVETEYLPVRHQHHDNLTEKERQRQR